MPTLLIIPATVLCVLATYLLARSLLGRQVPQETKDLAASVGFRIASLHGLIIALVFAQLALVYRNIEDDLIQEATAVKSIYSDAERHGGAGTAEIVDAARSYVRTVLDSEWHDLATGLPMTEAGQAQIDLMLEGAIALSASTAREQALRDGLIAEVRQLNQLRGKREGHTQRAGGGPFWFAAVSGLLMLSASYAPFDPTRRNLALLIAFAAYSGIIFALIHSFQNPFTPPGALIPMSFERLQQAIG